MFQLRVVSSNASICQNTQNEKKNKQLNLYFISQNFKTHSFLFFPRKQPEVWSQVALESCSDLQKFKILQIQFWGFVDLSNNGS